MLTGWQKCCDQKLTETEPIFPPKNSSLKFLDSVFMTTSWNLTTTSNEKCLYSYWDYTQFVWHTVHQLLKQGILQEWESFVHKVIKAEEGKSKDWNPPL